jgi:hypothetical protein
VTVTVNQLADAPDGTQRWQFRATLGDGHRVGYAQSAAEAKRLGEREERYLLALESHTPEELEARAYADSESAEPATVRLLGPTGTPADVPEYVVADLIKVGYRRPEAETPRRGPGRPRKVTADIDELATA